MSKFFRLFHDHLQGVIQFYDVPISRWYVCQLYERGTRYSEDGFVLGFWRIHVTLEWVRPVKEEGR
jgi:hypothetical protein